MNLLQPCPFLMLPLSESEPQKRESECQVQAPVHYLAKEAHGPVSDSPSEIVRSILNVCTLGDYTMCNGASCLIWKMSIQVEGNLSFLRKIISQI